MLAAGVGGLLALGALGVALGGATDGSDSPVRTTGQRFGVLSSLPIYRAPQASVADMLAQGEVEPHWLRAELEQGNRLDPIDLLNPQTLAGIDYLLLIQPRPLTPAENVALDDWVRGGGRVLLVSDPMLSGEPAFALGDPRNPQAISVTGPIEARWGLLLEPGRTGDDVERLVGISGYEVPVALGGTFAKRAPAGGDPTNCALLSEDLVASCSIGQGHAVLLADATMFEQDAATAGAVDVFWALLGKIGNLPAS